MSAKIATPEITKPVAVEGTNPSTNPADYMAEHFSPVGRAKLAKSQAKREALATLMVEWRADIIGAYASAVIAGHIRLSSVPDKYCGAVAERTAKH